MIKCHFRVLPSQSNFQLGAEHTREIWSRLEKHPGEHYDAELTSKEGLRGSEPLCMSSVSLAGSQGCPSAELAEPQCGTLVLQGSKGWVWSYMGTEQELSARSLSSGSGCSRMRGSQWLPYKGTKA